VKQMGARLDCLTWDNLECSVMECSVAPIYHPKTLYRAAHRAHRSMVRKKGNLRLWCEFLVRLSNNWPSFSFGPADKEFESLSNQIVNDMKQKYAGTTMAPGTNLNLNLSELSLESIGKETESVRDGAIVERKDISLIILCAQLSLGFVIFSNQSNQPLMSWLNEMIANLVFVMELYLRQCLDFNRIHLLMGALMDKNEEWSWTILCQVLMMYGQQLELTQASHLQMYFDTMQLRCQATPHCDNEFLIQTMLKQAITFRNNGWKKQEKPLTDNNNNTNSEEKLFNLNTTKSYASLAKAPFCNNSRKRLHIVTNGHDKNLIQNQRKSEDKRCTTATVGESLIRSINTVVADERLE